MNYYAERRVGLSLLKIFLCFEVILVHFWHDTSYPHFLQPFQECSMYSVPGFMVMSFMFLSHKYVYERNAAFLKKRLWRLCWPQFAWAVIYYGVYQLLFNGRSPSGEPIGVEDLILQIFTGSSPKLNATMWFQIDLIALTVLFFVLFRFLRVKGGVIGLWLLVIGAFWLEYSGVNYRLFCNLSYEMKFPLGRLAEMAPMAAFGIFLSYYHVFERINRGALICALLCLSGHFLKNPPGFAYSGASRILVAFSMITLALLCPWERLPTTAEKTARRLAELSRYTPGVYCVHRLVGRFVQIGWQTLHLEIDTFSMCIVIFVISGCVSALIARVPHRLCVELVE